MERYESAMAEMSLPKSERLRRESVPKSPCMQQSCLKGGSVRVGGGEDGKKLGGLSGDPFSFL